MSSACYLASMFRADESARVVCDPAVMVGKPVIKGTRITVEGIIERMAAGETESQILRALPHLKPEHLRAALACASQTMSADHIYPLAG